MKAVITKIKELELQIEVLKLEIEKLKLGGKVPIYIPYPVPSVPVLPYTPYIPYYEPYRVTCSGTTSSSTTSGVCN